MTFLQKNIRVLQTDFFQPSKQIQMWRDMQKGPIWKWILISLALLNFYRREYICITTAAEVSIAHCTIALLE